MQQLAHTHSRRCFNAGEHSRFRRSVAFAIVNFLYAAPALSDTPSRRPAADLQEEAVAAVWTSRAVSFAYHGFTTAYSCDGLRVRMHDLLIKLGARRDAQVRSFGCTHSIGPDPFAGVKINMSVLRPATQQDAHPIASHWQRVDLLDARDLRDPANAAGNCELISQIKQKILPLFATRNIDYSATCEHHHVVVGGTRLKVDVLIADQGARLR